MLDRTSQRPLGRFLLAIRDLYPKGLSLFWLAPGVLALVIIPEFLQHVAEIRIGMFDSREQAISVANSPERMVWGYLKVAGLVLTFLAAARFWWVREYGGRWWDVMRPSTRRLPLGLAQRSGSCSLVLLLSVE